MAEKKNIFISHIHEDDKLLPNLKELISKAGMEVRDGSINSDKPNNAKNHDYIMNQIIAPRIKWASTLVVLISPGANKSEWVNKEIDYAAKQGKQIVGVYAQGATESDLPKSLNDLGDSTIVGWQGERVVKAINGEITDWDDPTTGKPRENQSIVRITCQ
jgi:hypothetical protein